MTGVPMMSSQPYGAVKPALAQKLGRLDTASRGFLWKKSTLLPALAIGLRLDRSATPLKPAFPTCDHTLQPPIACKEKLSGKETN